MQHTNMFQNYFLLAYQKMAKMLQTDEMYKKQDSFYIYAI